MTWKRKLGWIGIGLFAFIVVVCVGAYWTLHTEWFHRYALAKIQQMASEDIGGQVRVRDFALQLHGLKAEAYGITIRGTEPKSARPLTQADQLTIRFKIVSLLRKRIDLNEIILQHPVVNLLVKKDGTSNLPKPPQSSNNNSANPFDLGINHVLIERGEVYYNDVKIPMDAELHDLKLEVRSRLLGKTYEGSLSYDNGWLRYAGTKPVPHNLTASFTATPSQLSLKPIALTLSSSAIRVEGEIQNYAQPLVNATYEITMHPQDFRQVLNSPAMVQSVPTGEIVLAGGFRYQYSPNVPMIRSFDLDGHVSSHELAVHSPDLRTVIRNIRGDFKIAGGNFDARSVEADVLDGHLRAVASMHHLDSEPVSRVHASVQSLSVQSAKAALRTANLAQLPVEGSVTGSADAAWSGGVQNIRGRCDLGLKGTLASASANSAHVPLDGAFHVSYDGKSNVAALTNTFVHTPQTRVDLTGTAGKRLNLSLQAHANDLRELDSLAAVFQKTQSSAPANATKSMNLGGTAEVQLHVDGSVNDPQLRGTLSGHNLQVENTQWRSLNLGLQASKSRVSIQNGSLVSAQQGYVNFSMNSTLSDWHYLPSSQVNLRVTSRGLAIKPLLQAARLDYPVSGDLSIDVSMHGSQLNPEGRGSVHLDHANLYGQRFQQFSVQFDGTGNQLTSIANVSSTAGSAKAKLTLYPQNKGYEIQLDAPGIKLAQLAPVQERNMGIQGVLSANVRGRGTLDNPQLTASLEIPQLQVRQASISGIKADLDIANQKAQLTLNSEVAQTSVQARGTLDLRGEHNVSANIDTKGMPIEGLLALYAPQRTNGPHGILEVHASVSGPLDDKKRMQGKVVIPTLTADYQSLHIGNTRPIQVRYANSIITVEPAEMTGTDTSIRAEGQFPLEGKAPATLSATGSIDMQLMRFFAPDVQSSGKLLLDVRGSGAAAKPSLQGQLRLQNVSMIAPDAPVGLANLNGVLDISNDQINIRQLAGEAGGGQVSARGTIDYRPHLQMNVALQTRSVRIRYQDAIRTVLDGDLSLVGTTDASTLSGRVLIDNLSFTQNFDLASFAGQLQSTQEETLTQGIADNIKLDINVQTSRDLNLTSNEVSLQGQANLRVIGTAANPVIVGRTEFTGGDVFLMNKRYQVERGIIQFSNPNRTEPVLNIRLTTIISQYNLSLNFVGPLDKMQTSYVSDPPLPTADIINLIARGQTTEQAASSPSNMGASSLLAQGAASRVSSGVQKLTGLSSLSIDPTLGGNNSDPGARIALQKRVTNNFLFTFATDVTSTQREIIQGEYKFNKRWSASVTRNENGGFAVDGKFHKRY